MATVSFEHVEKVYRSKLGETHAVKDLCLDVADREFIVLVGPSGCGKTTTLRLVAGLEEISDGSIRIGDRIVNDVAPKDRDIAMVFQNYALYPHMTVFSNMAFGLKMRRTAKSEIKRAVQDVAALLGIEHLLQRKPAALSGGERQRVAIGRAIVRRPKVFLFDEPLSNLDAKLRVHMRTEIKTLHAELKTTVIYVTHDQEEAMTLGDKLVIMKDGLVHQCGAPLELYDRPANRFVAGFIGTPPMNFLEGRIEGNGSATAFVSAAGKLSLPRPLAEVMAPHVGHETSLGVRPEHLHIGDTRSGQNDAPSDAQTNGATSLAASVTITEPLGGTMNVHFVDRAGTALVARVPPSTSIVPGDAVQLGFDMTHAHFFAPGDAGNRLN